MNDTQAKPWNNCWHVVCSADCSGRGAFLPTLHVTPDPQDPLYIATRIAGRVETLGDMARAHATFSFAAKGRP